MSRAIASSHQKDNLRHFENPKGNQIIFADRHSIGRATIPCRPWCSVLAFCLIGYNREWFGKLITSKGQNTRGIYFIHIVVGEIFKMLIYSPDLFPFSRIKRVDRNAVQSMQAVVQQRQL